jgi:hypothetical protein
MNGLSLIQPGTTERTIPVFQGFFGFFRLNRFKTGQQIEKNNNNQSGYNEDDSVHVRKV